MVRPRPWLLFTNSIVGGVTAWGFTKTNAEFLTACSSLPPPLQTVGVVARVARRPGRSSRPLLPKQLHFCRGACVGSLLCLDGWFAHANCCIAGQSMAFVQSRRTEPDLSFDLLATETLRRHLFCFCERARARTGAVDTWAAPRPGVPRSVGTLRQHVGKRDSKNGGLAERSRRSAPVIVGASAWTRAHQNQHNRSQPWQDRRRGGYFYEHVAPRRRT